VISHTDYSRSCSARLIIALVLLFPQGLLGALQAWRTGARHEGKRPP
jgi:heme A synthase